MAEEEEVRGEKALRRTFDHPPTAPVLSADFVQLTSTGNEIFMQFYATIPEPPGAQAVVSRLQATVSMSPVLAQRIYELLKHHMEGKT